MTLTPELQSLLDRDAIRNVVLRICRAMDRADIDLFRSCYHDDAWDDHGYYKGPVANFKPQSIFRPPHVKSVMHLIGNILIDLEGDTAWSEAYYLAYSRAIQNGTEKDSVFGGRYFDRFERRGGVWKIAHRTTIYDWTRVDPVAQIVAMPGAVEGCASRSDPSYRRASGP